MIELQPHRCTFGNAYFWLSNEAEIDGPIRQHETTQITDNLIKSVMFDGEEISKQNGMPILHNFVKPETGKQRNVAIGDITESSQQAGVFTLWTRLTMCQAIIVASRCWITSLELERLPVCLILIHMLAV